MPIFDRSWFSVGNLVKVAEINRRLPGSGQSISGVMDKAGAGRSLDLLYGARRSDLLVGELAVVDEGVVLSEVGGGVLSEAKVEEFLTFLGKVERRAATFTSWRTSPSVEQVKELIQASFGSTADSLRARGFSDEAISIFLRQGIDLRRLDEVLDGLKIYDDYPGINVFIREQTITEDAVLRGRCTWDIKKMVAADRAGKSVQGYVSGLKGSYTEHLAKLDTAGDTIKDLKHINRGGIDYVAMEGNTLKMVESKARQTLSVKDLKNYVKTDEAGNIVGYNMRYTFNSLKEEIGETAAKNYIKGSSFDKEFILYLNGPNSEAIKNSLNLPARVPYSIRIDGIEETGFVDIIVKAVNM